MKLAKELVLGFSLVGFLALCGAEPAPGTISDTKVCRRWRHSSVMYDNNVYIYGGNTWRDAEDIGTGNSTSNRDFVSFGLSNGFDMVNTPFVGLPVPPVPGPAKVLQGAFWVNEKQSKITFYGGAFSLDRSNRSDVVEPFSLWSYQPPTSRWRQETPRGDSILRASNGASAFYNGVGYYRGGQLDNLTVPAWRDGDGARVILSGMLKVDLETLSIFNETKAKGFDVFEFQDPTNTGFQYRDGNLVPITFNGKDYLINFSGGGPRGHALPMENVYIYDIAESTWYQQPIDGPIPINTRGACAIANTAPDNSSIQITYYGGTIYNATLDDFQATSEMWVLTIPQFAWIPLGPADTSIGPGARQDHTCHIAGNQMLVIGGRNSSSSCEGPGVWVFDTSTLQWQSSFTASTTYTVPEAVVSVIGGTTSGGALWENLPVIPPSDSDSPFFNLTTPYRGGGGKGLTGGAIAGIVIGVIAFIALVCAGIWWFYLRPRNKRKNEESLGDVPNPTPADEVVVAKKDVPERHRPEVSELASPTPSSQAPRYSQLSGYEPAQLHGESLHPVELESPPLPPDPNKQRGAYEPVHRKNLSADSTGSAYFNPRPYSETSQVLNPTEERELAADPILEDIPTPPAAPTSNQTGST